MDPLFTGAVLVALLLAFIVHEYAHGYTAYALGDPTPKYEGRLTLNPLVHIDPVGAVVLFSTMVVFRGGMVMGWAKPVRFDYDNLKQPQLDAALIAMAGPVSNFVLAFLAGLGFHMGLAKGVLGVMLLALVKANLGFGLFNCLPCPPLDGWKIVGGLMPRDIGYKMRRLEEKVGIYGVVFLLVFSVLLVNPILTPVYSFLLRMLTAGQY